MIARGEQTDPATGDTVPRALRLIPILLLLLLALRPPETLGASMAFCSALAVLFLLAAWRPASAGGGRVWLVVGAAVALPACMAGSAPGAAVQPVAEKEVSGGRTDQMKCKMLPVRE